MVISIFLLSVLIDFLTCVRSCEDIKNNSQKNTCYLNCVSRNNQKDGNKNNCNINHISKRISCNRNSNFGNKSTCLLNAEEELKSCYKH